MLTLLVSRYAARTYDRQVELGECVRRNARNPHVDRYAAVPQTGDRRATFADLYRWAADNVADGLLVVSNADIAFDDSIALVKPLDLRGKMLALTRHNELPDGRTLPQGLDQNYVNDGSFDCWITDARDSNRLLFDIQLGVVGCDSYFTTKAQRAGFEVSNPCLDVRALHVHRCDERDDRPDGRCYWGEADYEVTKVPWAHLDGRQPYPKSGPIDEVKV